MIRISTLELLFDGEVMKFLIGKDVKLLRGIFCWEKWVNFWLLGGILFWSPGISTKVQGKEDSHTSWGNKENQRRGHFWLEGGPRCIILGDNLAGYCFVLKDLVPRSFSNKLWLCNWKCMWQVQILVKSV